MEVSLEVLRGFSKRKTINDIKLIKHLSYSPNGTKLMVAGDGKLNIYDTLSGKLTNIICIDLQSFTPFTENTILVAKEKEIKYLSVYDNKYLSVLKGHQNKIDFVNACKINDWLISSCQSSTKIWELRSKNPIYEINLLNSIGSFFNDKLILVHNSSLKMYDTRNLRGPMKTVSISYSDNKRIESCYDYFSVSGTDLHQIFDKELNLIVPIRSGNNSHLNFTPDSQYYTYSSGDFLYFNDAVTKNKVYSLRDDTGNIGKMLFNPSYLQFVTADEKLNFWVTENE